MWLAEMCNTLRKDLFKTCKKVILCIKDDNLPLNHYFHLFWKPLLYSGFRKGLAIYHGNELLLQGMLFIKLSGVM